MSDTPDYLPEDYRYTADLLRSYAKRDDRAMFRTICSYNQDIILAALALAEAVAAERQEPWRWIDP